MSMRYSRCKWQGLRGPNHLLDPGRRAPTTEMNFISGSAESLKDLLCFMSFLHGYDASFLKEHLPQTHRKQCVGGGEVKIKNVPSLTAMNK